MTKLYKGYLKDAETVKKYWSGDRQFAEVEVLKALDDQNGQCYFLIKYGLDFGAFREYMYDNQIPLFEVYVHN